MLKRLALDGSMGVAAPALLLAIIMDLPLEAGIISNLGFF